MARTTEPENESEPAVFEAENIGPVTSFRATYDPNGCILQLLGEEGSGKTTLLNAAKRMHGGKGKLSKRDKSLKGTASGFGVRLNVSQSTTVRGELAFTSLEDQCGLETLVDPKIDDPLSADLARMKAVLTMIAVEADARLFWPLVGGQAAFESIVKLEKCEDLAVMYGRVKRALQAAAREKEKQQANAELNATSARQAAAGVDTNAEANADKLQSDLEFAIGQQSSLEQSANDAQRTRQSAQAAKVALKNSEDNYKGPTPQQAVDLTEKARLDVLAKQAAMLAAQKALTKAEREYDLSEQSHSRAVEVQQAAENHAGTTAAWREQIERAADIVAPAEDELDEAAQAVADARKANELGVLVRQARAKLLEADGHDDRAKTLAREAQQLRDADKRCDEVLSNVVQQLGTPLRIVDGRFVVDTERGETYFGELSTGQRAKVAVKIGIEAVGEGGTVAMDQELWQALSPHTQAEIWQDVQGSHVVVLVGKVSDGPLRGQIFEPETNGNGH